MKHQVLTSSVSYSPGIHYCLQIV